MHEVSLKCYALCKQWSLFSSAMDHLEKLILYSWYKEAFNVTLGAEIECYSLWL